MLSQATTRTPFAPAPRPPGGQVAVTYNGETRIFPTYRALRDAVLTDAQPLLDDWTRQAFELGAAQGRAKARREATLAVSLALCAPPLLLLLLMAAL